MKKHEPTEETREWVERMSAAGIQQENIARALGIHRETLAIHYREQLDGAADRANTQVARTLFAKATDPDMSGPSVTAAIFWLKTRGGWKETDRHEMTGADGGPLNHNVSIAVDWIKSEQD